METCALEEKVYSALLADTEIMGLLPQGEGSIFYLQAPAVYPDYPILIYTPISDVPILHGDNKEKLHRVTIRIHIIADDYWALYSAVKRVMAELDFTRVQATPIIDGGKKIMVADFKIVIGG